MKFITCLFILLLSSQLHSAQCRNYTPMEGDCSFYDECLEATYKCGPKAYPLNYGKKYCHRFSSLNTANSVHVFGGTLSSKGVNWRDFTLQCLQEELVKNMLDNRLSTCEDVKEQGFKTHVTCYTEGPVSICDLAVKDKSIIASTVQVDDYFSKEAVQQVVDVMIACRNSYLSELNAIDKKLDEIKQKAYFNIETPNQNLRQVKNFRLLTDFEIKLESKRKELLEQIRFSTKLKTQRGM